MPISKDTLKHKFPYRYLVEPWGKVADIKPKQAQERANGVHTSGSDYGYADDLFIISIRHLDRPGMASYCPLSTMDGGFPSLGTLKNIRDLLNHYIEDLEDLGVT